MRKFLRCLLAFVIIVWSAYLCVQLLVDGAVAAAIFWAGLSTLICLAIIQKPATKKKTPSLKPPKVVKKPKDDLGWIDRMEFFDAIFDD